MAAETQGKSRVAQLIESCADSHAEIAERVGVDKSLVTRWRLGERRPNAAHMARLEKLYGSSAGKARALPPPPPLELADADEDEDEDAVDDVDAPSPSPRGQGETSQARLRRYILDSLQDLETDTELSGVKKAEALKKLVDAQVALDRSTGENALTMARIVAHPEFVRVVRLITEAIAPYPEALAAATKALEVSA